MRSNLNRLKIDGKELETLIGLEVNNVLMLDIFNTPMSQTLRHPQRLFSLCLTEFFIFGFTLVVVFTLSLLLARNSGQSFEDAASIFRFLQIALVISLLVTIGWNIYLRIKGKHFLELLNLLNEVNKYNELIEAVDIIERLETASTELNLMNRDALIAALEVTRASLIAGLRTEKLLRENKGLIARRYEVFAYLENNFTTLMSLDSNNKAGEYGRLLNESLQIGMSVHKEVRKLQNRRGS